MAAALLQVRFTDRLGGIAGRWVALHKASSVGSFSIFTSSPLQGKVQNSPSESLELSKKPQKRLEGRNLFLKLQNHFTFNLRPSLLDLLQSSFPETMRGLPRIADLSYEIAQSETGNQEPKSSASYLHTETNLPPSTLTLNIVKPHKLHTNPEEQTNYRSWFIYVPPLDASWMLNAPTKRTRCSLICKITPALANRCVKHAKTLQDVVFLQTDRETNSASSCIPSHPSVFSRTTWWVFYYLVQSSTRAFLATCCNT